VALVSSPVQRVQGAGITGSGDPFDVNIIGGSGGAVLVTDIQDGAGVSIMDPALVAARVAVVNTLNAVVSGAVSISNFPAVQPVSGTVTANQGTGPYTMGQVISPLGNVWAVDGLCYGYDIRSNNLYPVSIIDNPILGEVISQLNLLSTFSVAGAVINPTTVASLRTPAVFKTINTAANGNTAIWTPAAGTKFRLMRYQVIVTGNAATAGGAVVTVSLNDAGGDIGQAHDLFIPNAAPAAPFGTLYVSPWIDLGNGVLSAAANNVLNVNLSAALTAGKVRVIACGTEE
jgi:hypothetical protein